MVRTPRTAVDPRTAASHDGRPESPVPDPRSTPVLRPLFPLVLVGALLSGMFVAASPPPAGAAAGDRAVVKGSYTDLGPGGVRVGVRSNAPRVTIAHRTARGDLRLRTVRVRAGLALTVLPAGSYRFVARAQGTARLRPSVRVRLGSSTQEADADGDGVTDYLWDADSNGSHETVIFDNDRNGLLDRAILRVGRAWLYVVDANQDGYIELIALDAEADGRVEAVFSDGDGDRFAELRCLDLIGSDGIADTWVDVRTQPPAASPERATDDAVTRGIVTLNQLSQLDPFSPLYIPYNSAPSLLR